MTNDDSYLGDGLYASNDGYFFELYSANGIEKTNQVLLDPEVLARFLEYVWLRLEPGVRISLVQQLIANLAITVVSPDTNGHGLRSV
jgi:hypothetical protein